MSKEMDISHQPIKDWVDTSVNMVGLNGEAFERYNVHGVFVRRKSVQDLNDMTIPGFYPLYGNLYDNSPEPHIRYGVLLVFDDGATLGKEFVQLMLTITTVPCIYLRKKGSGSGWSVWYKANMTPLPPNSD